MNNVLHGRTFVDNSGSKIHGRRQNKHIRGFQQYNYCLDSYRPIFLKEPYETKLDASLTLQDFSRDNRQQPSNVVLQGFEFGDKKGDDVKDIGKSGTRKQVVDEQNKVFKELSHSISKESSEAVGKGEDSKITSKNTALLEDNLKTIYEDSASGGSGCFTSSVLSNTCLLGRTVGIKRNKNSLNSKLLMEELTGTEQVATGSNSENVCLPLIAENNLAVYKLNRFNHIDKCFTKSTCLQNNPNGNNCYCDSSVIAKNTKAPTLEDQNTSPNHSKKNESLSFNERNTQPNEIVELHNPEVTKIENCRGVNLKKGKKKGVKNIFCCIRSNRSDTSFTHDEGFSNVNSEIITSVSKSDTDYESDDCHTHQLISEVNSDTTVPNFCKGRRNYSSSHDRYEIKSFHSKEVVRDSEDSVTFSSVPTATSQSSKVTMVANKHTQSIPYSDNDQTMSHINYLENTDHREGSGIEQEEEIRSEFERSIDYESSSGEEHSDYHMTNQDNFKFCTHKDVMSLNKCSICSNVTPETREENNKKFDIIPKKSNTQCNAQVSSLSYSLKIQNPELKDEGEIVFPDKTKKSTYVVDISFEGDQLLKYLGENELRDVLKTMTRNLIEKSYKKKCDETTRKTVEYIFEQQDAYTSMSCENVEVEVQTLDLQTKMNDEIIHARKSEEERTKVTETQNLYDALNEIKALRRQLLENCMCCRRVADVSQQTSGECNINQSKPSLVENSVQTNDMDKINANAMMCESLKYVFQAIHQEESAAAGNMASSFCRSKQISPTDLVIPRRNTNDDNIARWLWSPVDKKPLNFQSWPLEAVFSKAHHSEKNVYRKSPKSSRIHKKRHQLHLNVKTGKNLRGSEVSQKTNSELGKIVSENKRNFDDINSRKGNASNRNSAQQTFKKECVYRVNLAHKKYFNCKSHHRNALEVIPYSISIKSIKKEGRQQSSIICSSSLEDRSSVSGNELTLSGDDVYIEPNFKESTGCDVSFSLPSGLLSPFSDVVSSQSCAIHSSEAPSLDISPGSMNFQNWRGKPLVPQKDFDLGAKRTYQETCVSKRPQRATHPPQLSKEVKELFLVSSTLISSTESNDSQYCNDRSISMDKTFTIPAHHFSRGPRNATETKTTQLAQSTQTSSHINCVTNMWKTNCPHAEVGNSVSYWRINPNAHSFPLNTKETVTYFGVNSNNDVMNSSSPMIDNLPMKERTHIQSSSLFQTLGEKVSSRQERDIICFDVLNGRPRYFRGENWNDDSQRSASNTDDCVKTMKTNSRFLEYVSNFAKPLQVNETLDLGGNHTYMKNVDHKILSTGKDEPETQNIASRKNIPRINGNAPGEAWFCNRHKTELSQESQTTSAHCLDLDAFAKTTVIDKKYANQPNHFDYYGMCEGKPRDDVEHSDNFHYDINDSDCSIHSKSVLGTFVDSFRCAFTCFRPCALLDHLWRKKSSKTSVREPCGSEGDETNVQRKLRIEMERENVQQSSNPNKCSHHHVKDSQQLIVILPSQALKPSQQLLHSSPSLMVSENRLKQQMSMKTQNSPPFRHTPSPIANPLTDPFCSGVGKEYFGRSLDLQETYFKNGDMRHACHTVFHATIQNYNKSKSCEAINKSTEKVRQKIFTSDAAYPYEGPFSKCQKAKSPVSTQICGEGDCVWKNRKGSLKTIVCHRKKKCQKQAHTALQFPDNYSCMKGQENDKTEFRTNLGVGSQGSVPHENIRNYCAKK